LRVISSGQAEAWKAEEILGWAIKNFAPNLVLSCSFGAREGMVLFDMMHRIDPESRAESSHSTPGGFHSRPTI